MTRLGFTVIGASCLLSLSACGGSLGGIAPLFKLNPGSILVNRLIEELIEAADDGPASVDLDRRSVTQSFNTDPEGGMTDRVEASFGSGNLGVTITRQDGGEIAFNTADDTIPGGASEVKPYEDEYVTRDWEVFKHDNDSATTAWVRAIWNDSDPTDYLAGGSWLHLEGDVGSLNFERAEAGAFVDGPELDGMPDIPTTGSASYEGDSVGFIAYRYGSDHSERSFSSGDCVADAQLSANFDSRTIDGCIGCGGLANFSGLLVFQDGSTREFEEVSQPVEVRLDSAPIRSDGTFVSTGIDMRAFDDHGIVSSNGSWGGKFSTESDAGMPRLVAGTTGVNWTESDGSSGSMVGAFIASQQDVVMPPFLPMQPPLEPIDTAVARAANSAPSGSVTQSSNTDSQGVTTDSVEASLGSGNLGVTITRQDGDDIAFNTATDTIRSTPLDQDDGYYEREWTVFKHDNSSATTAEVFAFWNVNDHTDYLAGGYWLHFEGDVGSLNFDPAEAGAFMDGPELDGTPTIPQAGSASYEGFSAGLIAYRDGSSTSEIPEGSFTFGKYVAAAELSADFDQRTVGGCIGCGDTVELSGLSVSPDGSTTPPFGLFDSQARFNVTLASAPIRSDGTFVSTGIDMRAFDDHSIVSSNGSWGGKFSTESDADAGMPRLVAGTTGVNWTESDGSSGSMVGAFIAPLD